MTTLELRVLDTATSVETVYNLENWDQESLIDDLNSPTAITSLREFTIDGTPVSQTVRNVLCGIPASNWEPLVKKLQAHGMLDLDECLSILAHEVDDEDALDCLTWANFDEEFFETLESPMEAARATYFGDIKSWNDTYIRLNIYGNLESTNEIDYAFEMDDILTFWIEQFC